MKITLANLRQALISKVGGRALTNIANFYPMVQETCFALMSEVSLPSAIRRVPFLSPLIESPSLRMLPDDFSFEGLIDVYQRDYTSTVPYIRTGVTNNEFMRKVRSGALP